jgi:hypothetical protein
MKFIDLKPLNIARLKAYRKSIMAKISGFEVCDCGSWDCDHAKMMAQDIPDYINLCLVRDRVNKELVRKQQAEYQSTLNSAQVPTIAEEQRLHQPPRREWRKKYR